MISTMPGVAAVNVFYSAGGVVYSLVVVAGSALFDDPSMDDGLRRVLNRRHEVVLDGEWPDVW